MADEYGKMFKRIWGDPDFRALVGAEQLMYAKLISQSDISLAGVVTAAPTRWAKQTAGTSVGAIQDALDGLERARFIIVDEDTEEILVRSYIRADGLWKSSKTMKAISGAVKRVLSKKLRCEISRELARLDTSGLTEETANGFRSRDYIEGLIGNLIAEYPIPGACQIVCVWGLVNVGVDAVGVGDCELG
ncbi:hypothetical protein U6G28_08950 [Actinomycetaceae bacterium MB13-C1-2]|nr:hypothetical protein U6G28_08950 [Actinomycetaceae bacterium MB13-C1-2]